MKIAVIQFTPDFGDVTGNLDRIALQLSTCETDLAILPELCTTGYQMTPAELARLAEPFPQGPTARRLVELAVANDCYLVAGVAERSREGTLYNSAVLIGPRGHQATYRKTHLFADEKDLFAPGDTGFFVTEVRGCRVGMMICFDWIYPESARCLALSGADVIAHPANLVLPWCQRSMPLRCLENGVYVATANRCGTEDRLPQAEGLTFTGGSQMVSPRGDVLASAPVNGDAVITADIDPSRARDKWLTGRNHLLQDRRPELYGALDSERGSQ